MSEYVDTFCFISDQCLEFSLMLLTLLDEWQESHAASKSLHPLALQEEIEVENYSKNQQTKFRLETEVVTAVTICYY